MRKLNSLTASYLEAVLDSPVDKNYIDVDSILSNDNTLHLLRLVHFRLME